MLDQNFVSADMYFNGAGGGTFANPAIMSELNKALTTDGAGSGNASGGALIPQSLENTLKITTFKLKELKLWQSIAKRPAYAIAEEYNVLNSYGESEGGWISEGGLPNQDNSDYTREVGQVKYMGTVRSLSHQMTLVNTTVGNIIDQYDTEGTMHLLRLLEGALFYGDSRLNPLAFDGFKRIIQRRAPENVIDLRGKPITARVMETIDQIIAQRYGEIDKLFMSTKAKANLSKLLIGEDKKQIWLPQGGEATNLGMVVNKYVGNNSEFALENHKFIRERIAPKTTITRSLVGRVTAAPNAPVVEGVAAVDGTFSRMSSGTVRYLVSAVNDVAESLPSAASEDITVDAGDRVKLTITSVAGARYYRIYRNVVGENAMWLMDEVPDSQGATTVYYDTGLYIPGTSMAFGLYTDPDQGFCFKQLAPLMKLPLAQIDTSMRWAILLYGMLQVYQPKKQILLLNVGNAGMPSEPELEADPELEAYVRAGAL